uniref:AP-1 complex subunit gamma n=1 Tax=Araucaria cunninghamii TaxID=56994 RepID=A0A0D6R6I1_ARACU
MNAFAMGTRLRDMIRAIRACKTAAEERAVVRKECAAIRTAISENDPDYRHRNLAKLMFIHMLGYPTHFGQMECLKLIASAGFPEKRIGYLGLMLLLDERQEVLMLVTNSLKQDLNHMNQYIVGLALCALGNICSAEMARDLAPEVEKLLQSSNPNIRKKAALCSVRIIRKVPDLAENFMRPASALLSEKHHGVLIAGIQLCTELCKASIEALDHIRKYTKDLVRILKNMITSGYAPEYDISGITDPFLQIRVLRLLRLLGKGDADSSDIMSDILAQVATNTESNKNAGNAILYECVQTIMAIEAIGGLRVLAINILGRFLSNRDNNIRYVALNMLMKAVTVDFQAVQRHRTTILECVKDSDASIRKRALELAFLLVNDTNVKPLTKELLEYLEVSDPEFKSDLTAKICSIVEKFTPSKQWYIDQMIKVLVEAGSYVTDEVCHSLIVVISNAMDLQGYTVRCFYRASQHWNQNESLVRVTVWCIGEYGEMLLNHAGELDGEEPLTVTESDVVDVLEGILKGSTGNVTTRAMALTALLKLSSRFPPCAERIKDLITQHKGSLALELQQRSIEFSSILYKHENIKSTLVERMPVLDELAYAAGKKADAAGGLLATGSSTKATSSGTAANLPNGVSKPPTNALMDLLDLSVDDTPTPTVSSGDILQDLLGVGSSPAPTFSGVGQASTGGADVLLDLLSIGTPPAPAQSTSTDLASFDQAPSASVIAFDPLSQLASLASPISPPQQRVKSFGDNRSMGLAVNGIHEATKPSLPASPMVDLLGDLSPAPAVSGDAVPTYPSIVAFESKVLKVTFDFTKQPDKPQLTSVQASFTNLTSNTYTDFIFQAAVPKFMQLHLDPASSNILPPSGNGKIVQGLSINNSQHGQKPLAMRLRIAYKVNGQDVVEQGQVNNFPAGL